MAIQKLQDVLQGVLVLAVHKNGADNNILRYILPDFGLRAEVVDKYLSRKNTNFRSLKI